MKNILFSGTALNFRRPIRAAALTAAACLALSTAYAGTDAGEAPQITVKYGDLDLSRAEGATVLFQRIRSAAAKTCDQFNSREVGVRAKFTSCMDHAIADAVLHVDRPALLQVYNEKTGRSLAPRLASLQHAVP